MRGFQTDGRSLTSRCEHAPLVNFFEFIDLFGAYGVTHRQKIQPTLGSRFCTAQVWLLTPGFFLCPFVRRVAAVVCRDARVPGREDWSSRQTRMTKMSKSSSKRLFFYIYFLSWRTVTSSFVSKIKQEDIVNVRHAFRPGGLYTWRPLS